jgi:hypothetical protein
MAGPRTAVFVTRSMLRSSRPGRRLDIPTQPITPAFAASVLLDELTLPFMPSLSLRNVQLDEVRRETDDAITELEARGWLANPASYHLAPPAPTSVKLEARRSGRIRFEALAFESGYQPPPEMPGALRWTPSGNNAVAWAYVLRHRGRPRPWFVDLHGFMRGKPLDLWFLRALHWFRDRGFNYMMPVAPLHGPRADRQRGPDALFSLRYLDTVHGFSQAVWDIRRCLAWVREQDAPKVVVHGVSMGGFLASLVASVDPHVDQVAVGIPLVDIAGVAAAAPAHVRRSLAHHELLGERADVVHRVISPLAMSCKVEHKSRFVYSAVGDRFTTTGQAYQLWNHWDQPEVLWFPGGHIAHMTRARNEFLDRAIGYGGAITTIGPEGGQR